MSMKSSILCGIIISVLGLIDCRNGIINLIESGTIIASFILAVIITLLWRSNFVYITSNFLQSWFSTFVGSLAISFILVSFLSTPLSWLIGVFFNYWYVFAALAFLNAVRISRGNGTK